MQIRLRQRLTVVAVYDRVAIIAISQFKWFFLLPDFNLKIYDNKCLYKNNETK